MVLQVYQIIVHITVHHLPEVHQNLVMEVVKQHRRSIQKVIQELLKQQMKELQYLGEVQKILGETFGSLSMVSIFIVL